MARVLIVEDSAQIREAVTDFFVERSNGAFIVDAAPDGTEGLKAVTENEYDIVILDIMMPGPSGYDICRKLREKSDCPIVFLTALGTEDNILLGYEMGADEYITKPFSLMILYTKCLVLLDRKVKRQQERLLESGDIKLYPSRMQVIAGGKEVELAYKEYFLLKALLENKGHVLSRQKLLDLVWGTDYFGNDRVVDTHIKNIRHKLGASGNQIRTVIGCGYKAV